MDFQMPEGFSLDDLSPSHKMDLVLMQSIQNQAMLKVVITQLAKAEGKTLDESIVLANNLQDIVQTEVYHILSGIFRKL